jgi:cell shape-determining protein MreC
MEMPTEAKPEEPSKEVKAEFPPPPIITSEDIEKLKETGKKIGELFGKVKHFIETREERRAEREITELEREIEKLKLLEEKAKRIEALEAEKKKLREQLEALKQAKLKETV